MDPVGGEVDVRPAQRAQLALADPGLCRGRRQGGVLPVLGGAHGRGELLGADRRELPAVTHG